MRVLFYFVAVILNLPFESLRETKLIPVMFAWYCSDWFEERTSCRPPDICSCGGAAEHLFQSG